MRLRVREASNGRTWRVQIQETAPSINDLNRAVASQVFPADGDISNGNQKIVFSLNKKVRCSYLAKTPYCLFNLEIILIRFF